MNSEGEAETLPIRAAADALICDVRIELFCTIKGSQFKTTKVLGLFKELIYIGEHCLREIFHNLRSVSYAKTFSHLLSELLNLVIAHEVTEHIGIYTVE